MVVVVVRRLPFAEIQIIQTGFVCTAAFVARTDGFMMLVLFVIFGMVKERSFKQTRRSA